MSIATAMAFPTRKSYESAPIPIMLRTLKWTRITTVSAPWRSIDPPTLLIRPWHQAGNSVSLRDFTNTSFNHHHGIQSTERFGANTDGRR
jgi:hypothetical protein